MAIRITSEQEKKEAIIKRVTTVLNNSKNTYEYDIHIRAACDEVTTISYSIKEGIFPEQSEETKEGTT